MRNNKRMLGNMLLMLTAMIWGTAFVFQRVGMEDIEPITFNAARMALAAVAVGAVSLLPMASEKEKLAIMSRKERAAYRRNTIIGGICCGTFLSAASIFQQMGIVYTTAGKAGFITAMYMLLVPVIGFLALGGKCRDCKAPISPRYIIMDLLVGVLFTVPAMMIYMSINYCIQFQGQPTQHLLTRSYYIK